MDTGIGYTRGNIPEVSPGTGAVCDPRHTVTTAYPPPGVAVLRGVAPVAVLPKEATPRAPKLARGCRSAGRLPPYPLAR